MRELKINKVYRHFKGKYYLVEAIANNSETSEPMVVYRHLYGDGSLCVRPLDMFLSEVDHEKYPDVKQKYRFEEVDGFFEERVSSIDDQSVYIHYIGTKVSGRKFFDTYDEGRLALNKMKDDESITDAVLYRERSDEPLAQWHRS